MHFSNLVESLSGQCGLMLTNMVGSYSTCRVPKDWREEFKYDQVRESIRKRKNSGKDLPRSHVYLFQDEAGAQIPHSVLAARRGRCAGMSSEHTAAQRKFRDDCKRYRIGADSLALMWDLGAPGPTFFWLPRNERKS